MVQPVSARKLCARAFLNGHGFLHEHVRHPMLNCDLFIVHTAPKADTNKKRLGSQCMLIGLAPWPDGTLIWVWVRR